MLGNVTRVTEFWRNVQVREPDKCWPWLDYLNEDGYGAFFWEGRMMGAHELAVTFTTGERRSEDLDTCHSCGNRPCCNPSHLRFDTRRSNVADMMRHGTHVVRRKLSDGDVAVIRSRHAHGAPQKVLAAHFGVSASLVSGIVNNLRRVAIDAR